MHLARGANGVTLNLRGINSGPFFSGISDDKACVFDREIERSGSPHVPSMLFLLLLPSYFSFFRIRSHSCRERVREREREERELSSLAFSRDLRSTEPEWFANTDSYREIEGYGIAEGENGRKALSRFLTAHDFRRNFLREIFTIHFLARSS